MVLSLVFFETLLAYTFTLIWLLIPVLAFQHNLTELGDQFLLCLTYHMMRRRRVAFRDQDDANKLPPPSSPSSTAI